MTGRIARSSRARVEKPNVQEMEHLLKSIAKDTKEKEEAEARITSNSALLFSLMQSAKQSHIENSLAVADVVTPMGRASSYIDPVKFREAVADDKDFYACIQVGITAAKGVLSGKELAAITTSVPGVAKAPELKVKMKK